MDIKVEFDDEQLVWFKNGEGSLFFEVTWEDKEIHYPMDNWSDFGDIVLGMWITTILELLEGANEGEFLFMDGPYLVKAKYYRKTGMVALSPKGLDVVWNMQLTELVKKLIQALDKAREELAKREIREKQQAGFEKYSAILGGYL